MKKLLYSFIFTLLMGTSVSSAIAAPNKTTTELSAQDQSELLQIQKRVEEIRAMDRSELTREQKRELKSELKDMNARAKKISGGGIYLSTGAVIIIILLLIILL